MKKKLIISTIVFALLNAAGFLAYVNHSLEPVDSPIMEEPVVPIKPIPDPIVPEVKPLEESKPEAPKDPKHERRHPFKRDKLDSSASDAPSPGSYDQDTLH